MHKSDVSIGLGPSLEYGMSLRNWWQVVDSQNAYQHRFNLVRAFNKPVSSFGFTGVAHIYDQNAPVMGEVEELFFDQPKSGDVEAFREELREFVLRYLLRVSDFRQPAAYVSENNPTTPRWSQRTSICPTDEARKGFGYSQCYYKRADTGEVGRFPKEKEHEIVDVRKIGRTYEWILLRVKIFDFSFTAKPFGQRLPQLRVPLDESSFLVMSPDFIIDKTGLATLPNGERVIGQYGFGYAFVRNPAVGLLGYGPGEFDVAFQQIHFRVLENGEARVQLVFVANRPRRILNVPLVPVNLSFDIANAVSFGMAEPFLRPIRQAASQMMWPTFDPVTTLVDSANLASFGQAARHLCISRERLEKAFLLRHFKQHHEMITGALLTWREIPDWTDEGALPDWVKTGVSS